MFACSLHRVADAVTDVTVKATHPVARIDWFACSGWFFVHDMANYCSTVGTCEPAESIAFSGKVSLLDLELLCFIKPCKSAFTHLPLSYLNAFILSTLVPSWCSRLAHLTFFIDTLSRTVIAMAYAMLPCNASIDEPDWISTVQLCIACTIKMELCSKDSK